jgi:hypothetical protein
MGQVLQGGEQRPNRMAHLSSFAARRSSGSHPLKTRASRECAELFSPFSSFDRDCQCCSFPIPRNRDKISTRKFDVEVFTQAGPNSDLGPTAQTGRFRTPVNRGVLCFG